MLENRHCHFPNLWPIAAIRKPDSGRIVYKKNKFSLTVAFYLAKTENRTKISLTQLSRYCYE